MTDEVLQELWATKDSIAQEHGYNMDGLVEYFLEKQSARRGRFHHDEQAIHAEHRAPAPTTHE